MNAEQVALLVTLLVASICAVYLIKKRRARRHPRWGGHFIFETKDSLPESRAYRSHPVLPLREPRDGSHRDIFLMLLSMMATVGIVWFGWFR